jgi:hypothetical protein
MMMVVVVVVVIIIIIVDQLVELTIGGGNWSIQRRPTPVTLYPPQIPHDLIQA